MHHVAMDIDDRTLGELFMAAGDSGQSLESVIQKALALYFIGLDARSRGRVLALCDAETGAATTLFHGL